MKISYVLRTDLKGFGNIMKDKNFFPVEKIAGFPLNFHFWSFLGRKIQKPLEKSMLESSGERSINEI